MSGSRATCPRAAASPRRRPATRHSTTARGSDRWTIDPQFKTFGAPRAAESRDSIKFWSTPRRLTTRCSMRRRAGRTAGTTPSGASRRRAKAELADDPALADARRNERRLALARALNGAVQRRFGSASACARDAFDMRSAPGTGALFTRVLNIFNGLVRSLRKNVSANAVPDGAKAGWGGTPSHGRWWERVARRLRRKRDAARRAGGRCFREAPFVPMPLGARVASFAHPCGLAFPDRRADI